MEWVAEPEFDPPKQPELLSLGLIVGGLTPKNELLDDSFGAMMRWVRDNRGRYPNDGLRINIVFQVPGPISQPGFEGVFPARFARKTNHLLVNAAVPASLELNQVRAFFLQTLKDTQAAADEYLKKRKIKVNTANVMAFIDELIRESAPGDG